MSMEPLAYAGPKIQGPGAGVRGLAWIAGALATVAAAGVAALLALVFAATVVIIGLMAAAVLSLGAVAYRARRALRRPPPANADDPTLLEARHLGGHSWVAYGWDQRGR